MKDKNHNIVLGLFFTYGVSLKLWDETGLLTREIALYNKLAKEIKTIYFFTYGNQSDLEYKKCLASNIIIVPKPVKMSNKLYSLLIPILHYKKMRECTILKTNQMDGSWTAVLSKLLFKKKLIVRTGYCWSINLKHAGLKLRYYLARIIEQLAYAFADTAIVTSQRNKLYVEKQYNYENVKLIPNYVDTDKFYPKNIAKKNKTICFVGRLSEEKNLFSLITALIDTDINLAIIGDGKLKEQLNKFAKEHNVHVNFYGIIPNKDLPNILNQFEVFILPSLIEGNPKALLEAMACGLCVIGTNVEGIREVIQHNKTGILCDTNANSLKLSIVTAFENNKLRRKLKNNAAAFILENYALDKLFRKELATYLPLFKK